MKKILLSVASLFVLAGCGKQTTVSIRTTDKAKVEALSYAWPGEHVRIYTKDGRIFEGWIAGGDAGINWSRNVYTNVTEGTNRMDRMIMSGENISYMGIMNDRH